MATICLYIVKNEICIPRFYQLSQYLSNCIFGVISLTISACCWHWLMSSICLVLCDTREPGREVMLGVPSRPKASVGTQTAPKPFPPRMLHQSVDTGDLEKGLKGLNIATQTPRVWAGKGARDSEEGAAGEVSYRERGEESGWEWVSIQDPWSGKWE